MTAQPPGSAERPGIVGVTILSAEAEEVVGRLDFTAELVAGTGFLWAPVVITLADRLCAVGTGANLPEGALHGPR